MYNFYSFWSLWPSTWWSLSLLNRLFVVILLVVAVYSVVSAAIALKSIRALRSTGEGKATTSVERKLAALSRRCFNLRQILGATFFLFGFLLFISLPNATITIGDGRGIPAFEIVNNFVFQFLYAANVFLVFLVVHLIQWFTSTSVQACAARFRALTEG